MSPCFLRSAAHQAGRPRPGRPPKDIAPTTRRQARRGAPRPSVVAPPPLRFVRAESPKRSILEPPAGTGPFFGRKALSSQQPPNRKHGPVPFASRAVNAYPTFRMGSMVPVHRPIGDGLMVRPISFSPPQGREGRRMCRSPCGRTHARRRTGKALACSLSAACPQPNPGGVRGRHRCQGAASARISIAFAPFLLDSLHIIARCLPFSPQRSRAQCMANLAAALRATIGRLARKEIRGNRQDEASGGPLPQGNRTAQAASCRSGERIRAA